MTRMPLPANPESLSEPSEDGLNISSYIKALLRNKWTIIFITILCTAAGAYIAKSAPPVYSATARILADPYQPNADREEQYIASAMVFLFFETQYEIIRSRAISEQVVERLNLVEKFKKEQAENEPKITIVKEVKNYIKELLAIDNKEEHELTDEDLKIFLANKISQSLKVTGGRKNQIITVSYESKSAVDAANIINAVSDVYIDFGLQTRLSDVKNTQQWLGTQYSQLKKNLEESEQRVKEYREQEGLIHSFQQRAIANNQLQALNTNLVSAQTELGELKEQYQLIQDIKAGTGDFYSISDVMQDYTISALIRDQATAQKRVDELSERYLEKHPKMIAAQSEFKSASNNLQDATANVINQIEKAYNIAEQQVININKLISDTKADIQTLQGESFALVSLEREVENNRRIYESFQSRLLEANVKGEINASNVHIIDRATIPKIPISPNVKKIILASLLLGLFLGVAVSLLKEAMDTTIKTPDSLEKKLKLPVLGITPSVKTKRNQIVPELQYLNDSRSPFAENINTIRTGLIFSNIDNPPKTILVTSATSAEGKSTLALNLACSFSSLGKTLLLEVDLRKPSILKNLSVSKPHGLTDILTGEIKELDEVSHRPGNENFHVISCGSIPQNPMELLSSEKFEQLLNLLKRQYQYIVLDGPPTLPVSDACILGNKVDAVVVAAKANQTKIKVLKETVHRLKRLNANVIGSVLTIAEPKKMNYYGDNYYVGEYYGVQPDKLKAETPAV